MKIAPFALALTLTVGCGSNLFGNGQDAGASPTTGDASSGVDAAAGAGCTGDLGNGVKLCTFISLCPSLGFDHDQFPDCGFRVRGDVLDLECVCNGALCPMGTPTTCAQAKQLMGAQTELQICQQVAEGRCTSLAPVMGGGTNPCDTACSGQCGGDPSCIKGCGC